MIRSTSRHVTVAAALGSLAVLTAMAVLGGGRPAAAVPATIAHDGVARLAGADLIGACRTAEPYYAVAVLSTLGAGGDLPDDQVPSVVAFGGPSGSAAGEPIVLATRAQLGDVYGLGYDATRHQLYAAAYLRVGGAYGPGGAGQIYRIDLESGHVEPWATVAVGPDRHLEADGGVNWVGRAGLADLDVAEDGSELYVVNLTDRRIQRLSLPDGRTLGTIKHGALAVEQHERDMRPFGLGVSGGWLYHAEVDTRETDPGGQTARLVVFKSRPDGSQMQAAVYGSWDYPRTVPWAPWPVMSVGRGTDSPMPVDVVLGDEGAPVVGLRDRQVDTDPACVFDPACAAGASVGDLLPATTGADPMMHLVASPPWFQDTDPANVDVTFGALAKVPGVDLVVSAARTAAEPASAADRQLMAYWFAVDSGARMRGVPLRTGLPVSALAADPGAVPGDVEVLCGSNDESGGSAAASATADAAAAGTATADADMRARATQRAVVGTLMAPTIAARSTGAAATRVVLQPTLTAEAPTRAAGQAAASATATAIGPRLTAAVRGGTDVARLAAAATALPPARATTAARARRAVESSCGSSDPYMATTRFVPWSDGTGKAYDAHWFADQSAVIVFNDTADDDLTRHYAAAVEPEVGAVFGEAYDLDRGQLYLGAYVKRLARLGPLGTGGIYRYDLATGRTLPFAKLDAGADPHRTGGSSFDNAASPFVTRTGLGDLELVPEADELLAVNLYDRLIYRISVPDGRVLGAFPNGAAAEPWAEDAVPFGLGARDGWVFHGVTDTGEHATPARRQAAYIYRSRPDGSQMAEVARLYLDYNRAPYWGAWAAPPDPAKGGLAEPILTDIEFREDGDLVLGLRDRLGDSLVLTAGDGDMVLTTHLGDRWFPMPDPELYNDNIRHPESSWGSLASLPWLDEVVSTVIDPVQIYSGGIAWFSNRDGSWSRLESIYYGANVTFGKASGLGDLESLCRALPPPPTETPTPTRTATATATVTASPTATITPTATRAVWTIYLPLAKREPCVPEEMHADVVLVLDMSTSMYRRTLSNRTKHQAAIDAARQFVRELDMTPGPTGGPDRVGVVGFNDTAWTSVDLTSDLGAIDQGLDRLLDRIAEGTRLDLALGEGAALFQRAGRREGNQKVLILLTDGLPNRVPTPVPVGSQEATVVKVANAVKASGVRVFTVGLGVQDDVFDSLLSQVASRPEDYYFAPDGDDLAAIYRQIAGRIVECP